MDSLGWGGGLWVKKSSEGAECIQCFWGPVHDSCL